MPNKECPMSKCATYTRGTLYEYLDIGHSLLGIGHWTFLLGIGH